MGEQRRRYSEEFKQKAVDYLREQTTKSLEDVALELDVPSATLSSWKSKYHAPVPDPLNAIDRIRELERLVREQERRLQEKDRELANVVEELAIVKKAVHIFGKPRSGDSDS